MAANTLQITEEHNSSRIRLYGDMSVAFEEELANNFSIRFFTTTSETFVLESSIYQFCNLEGNIVNGLIFGGTSGSYIELQLNAEDLTWYIIANNLISVEGGGPNEDITEKPLSFLPLPTLTPLDYKIGRNFRGKLTADAKLANPTNMNPGDRIFIVVEQDTVGNHKLTFEGAWGFKEAQPPVFSTEPQKVDYITAYLTADRTLITDVYVDYSIVRPLAYMEDFVFNMQDAYTRAIANPVDGQTVQVIRDGWRTECNGTVFDASNTNFAFTLRIKGVQRNDGSYPELKLHPNDRPTWGKALINIEHGKSVVVEDLSIAGASAYDDGNGTGILINGGVDHVLIKNVHLHDNENGVRSTISDHPHFDLIDVLLERNGTAANPVHQGFSHSIYAGESKIWRGRRVTFSNPVDGHNIKTRSLRTQLDQVYAHGARGARELDVCDQGVIHARNCVFWKYSNAVQNNLIGIGHELLSGPNRVQQYFFINCYFHNDVDPGREVTYLENRAKGSNNNNVAVHFIDCLWGGRTLTKVQSRESIFQGPYTITQTEGPLGPVLPVGDARQLFNTTLIDPAASGNPLNIALTPMNQLPAMIVLEQTPPYPTFAPVATVPPLPSYGAPVGEDKIPPTVSLSVAMPTIEGDGGVTLTAAVSDNVGITKVEFYRNGQLYTTVMQSPWKAIDTFEYEDNGTEVAYTAKAFDAKDNWGMSAVVNVTINIPPPDTTGPIVSMVANKNFVVTQENIVLTVTASDVNGIDKVELYKDGALHATIENSPFTFTVSHTYADNGVVEYTARAYDNKGNYTFSTSVDVTVNIPVPRIKPETILDAATQNEYDLAVVGAAVGTRRIAAANAIIDALSPITRFYIYRDGGLAAKIEYAGACTVLDDSYDISVQLPSVIDSSEVLVSGDFSSGQWWFEVQGGTNYARYVAGSIGLLGSGADVELQENLVAGQGLSGSPNLVLPRLLDNL